MIFKNDADKQFIDNITPRPGEPVHSDLWSQIYDYLYIVYPEMNREERSQYLADLLAYKESK